MIDFIDRVALLARLALLVRLDIRAGVARSAITVIVVIIGVRMTIDVFVGNINIFVL